MPVNADLHIHSPYSMAVSRFMQPEQLLAGCRTKGIHVLGTGDALQPDWQKDWEPYLENDAWNRHRPAGRDRGRAPRPPS